MRMIGRVGKPVDPASHLGCKGQEGEKVMEVGMPNGREGERRPGMHGQGQGQPRGHGAKPTPRQAHEAVEGRARRGRSYGGERLAPRS